MAKKVRIPVIVVQEMEGEVVAVVRAGHLKKWIKEVVQDQARDNGTSFDEEMSLFMDSYMFDLKFNLDE